MRICKKKYIYNFNNFILQSKEDEDFSDVATYGVVDVVGDDAVGRKIIVISACKLPSNKEVDHPRLLRYESL